MRYIALATDYDGTLAHDGTVLLETASALDRLLDTGRKLVLVTGRRLDDLLDIFPHTNFFHRIVAENGGVLYCPQTKDRKRLGEPPPAAFAARLRERGVAPLSCGQVIVATARPHESAVVEAIRTLGLDLQVTFNRDAVMVLPSGIDKRTGLTAALAELGLSAHNTVGVGDAENDHTFLSACEFAVAVDNALATVKEEVDWVTNRAYGAGVVELIDRLLSDDLRGLTPPRHRIGIGVNDAGEAEIDPYGTRMLLAGAAASSRMAAAAGIVERIAERGYQVCLLDPEGEYEAIDRMVSLGDGLPTVVEVIARLERPGQNLIVNMAALSPESRPGFFAGLLTQIQELRARTGRPHWVVVDEAHQLLPAAWGGAPLRLPRDLNGVLWITPDPAKLARAVLDGVDLVLTVGPRPGEALRALGELAPGIVREPAHPSEVVFWNRAARGEPVLMRVHPPHAERRRRQRKYATGDLGDKGSFYFRGPGSKLNVRASNVLRFSELAEKVDDITWEYHLRNGDCSRWFREALEDDELAAEAAEIEKEPSLSTAESRRRIRHAIDRRYALPS